MYVTFFQYIALYILNYQSMKQLLLILIFGITLLWSQNLVISHESETFKFTSDSVFVEGRAESIKHVHVVFSGRNSTTDIYTENYHYSLTHRSILIYDNYGSPNRLIKLSKSENDLSPWVLVTQTQDDFAPYDYHTFYASKYWYVTIIYL
jgi:hypothetical protein